MTGAHAVPAKRWKESRIMARNILILSPEASWLGGVVNFVSSMKKNFSDEIRPFDFQVGDRRGRRWAIAKYFQPFKDAFNLFFELGKASFDVIHVNPSFNYRSLFRDGLFMLVLSLRGRRNTLVLFHGWDIALAERIISCPVRKAFMRLTFGRAARVLVLAGLFKSQLVRMGLSEDRIEVVSTMFDGGIFNGLTDTRPAPGKTVLFLARFIREKGIFELLEAFGKIRARHPEARLVLAGDGPEHEAVRERVRSLGLEDSVFLPGYLRDKDKARALVEADVFALPSSYGEGCPVSLLEAMAAGLAVVATRAGGIPDIVEDPQNGILIDQPAPESIEKALERFFSDPEFLKNVRETNREQAWEKYEAGVVTKRIEALYSEVVSHGR